MESEWAVLRGDEGEEISASAPKTIGTPSGGIKHGFPTGGSSTMRRKGITALLFLTAGMSVFLTSSSATDQKPTANSSPQSQQKTVVTERDQQVLEALLLYLMSHDISGIDPRGGYEQLFVSPKTSVISASSIAEMKKKRRLKVSEDLWEDLRKRNTQAISFEGVKFKDKRIILRDTSHVSGFEWGKAFRKAYPKAQGVYNLNLPGYSRDGQRAIVWFDEEVPQIEYMGEHWGLYLMVKHKGQWNVTVLDYEFGE